MTNQAATPQDRCPQWALSLIGTLRDLEIRLGNLHPDGPWSEATLDTIAARVDKDPEAVRFDENAVNELFKRLAFGLTDEGHTPETIAQFINSRLTAGQRLAYCSAAEVSEVLAGR
jgi:hypothetical protein